MLPSSEGIIDQGFYSPFVHNWPNKDQLPLVYSDKYNISFLGLEYLQRFDSQKYRRVVGRLVRTGVVSRPQLVEPLPVNNTLLLKVHSEEYLNALDSSNFKLVQIIEQPALLLLPRFLLHRLLVNPLRYQLSGTVLAVGLAVERGWAINVGGGMHHASRDGGRAWSVFNDISLSILCVREATAGRTKKVLLLDLDALQGSGPQRDQMASRDPDLFIVDMFNSLAFPRDDTAKEAIDIPVELSPGAGDEEYLHKLTFALEKARLAFQPDLIIYNAGSNILHGDPSGRLDISPEGLIQRDEKVFQYASDLKVPICMLMSGGNPGPDGEAVANSLTNLVQKFHLAGPPGAPP